jgi:[histone H3]-lysine36 N-dimethyltransferase SETMAR
MVGEWQIAHPKSPTSQIILHQDNARPHVSHHSKAHMDELGLQLLKAPPYSPDLAPCDFWLFPHIKKKLEGRIFNSDDEIIGAYSEVLGSLQQSDFHRCFDEWFKRVCTVLDNNGSYYK